MFYNGVIPQEFNGAGVAVASYADALWTRHAIFLYISNERTQKAVCNKRVNARNHRQN